jgi:preprotein translocase subunit SecA
MSELLLRPGLRAGGYPQKQDNRLTEFEQSASLLFDKVRNRFGRNRFTQQYIVKKIQPYEAQLSNSSEENLSIAILELREKLQRYGLTEALIAQAFATIREAAGRTLGKRHFDEQLFGGWLMINGMLAEMETGEGKTLATTLSACTAAMAGIPVHVITANDYLAARDAEMAQPLYRRLGLKTSTVIDGMKTAQRRKNYDCHIVHTTNKQIAFDYLRDRIEVGDDTGALRFQYQQIQRENDADNSKRLLLRGLCYAIIDEADSVLIDEAKTPLIITQTRPGGENPETYADALYLAANLANNEDFTVDAKTRKIEFTQRGETSLAEIVARLPSHWQSKRKREILVEQALNAEYFYKKNIHYVVNEDKVQIVDEFTGRIMADRAWEQGLQQMIEAKEGCVISEQRDPLARISYQRFFKRYLRLAGTSGTIKEVADEMHSVYGLQTVKVATHKPSKRIMMPEQLYRTLSLKKQAFIKRVVELHAHKRPVLVGTNSVAESEEVSYWLKQAGLPHLVLNAKQDQHEAEIIAGTGQQQAITVATNMAGRGTDIVLGLGVADLGGLHVIALSRNEARRIDRQLFGRCARQGDPGSSEAILSLQDNALQHYYSSTMLRVLAKFCGDNKPINTILGKLILRLPQRKDEKNQRIMRRQLIKQDRQLSHILAFSGKFE